MNLFDHIFSTEEDRDRARRYAKSAIEKHGANAAANLRGKLGDHRRSNSKRAIRIALSILTKTKAE